MNERLQQIVNTLRRLLIGQFSEIANGTVIDLFVSPNLIELAEMTFQELQNNAAFPIRPEDDLTVVLVIRNMQSGNAAQIQDARSFIEQNPALENRDELLPLIDDLPQMLMRNSDERQTNPPH